MKPLTFLCAFALVLFSTMYSQPASAGDLMVGGQFRAGLAHLESDADNAAADDDDDTAFGIGGQLFAVYKFIEEIGVGLNFDFNVSFHEFGDNNTDVTADEIGFGVIVRSDLIDVLALCLWLNYTAGQLTYDTNFFGDIEVEGDGFEIGIAGFYKFQVHSMPIFVELGPVLTYGTYEADDENLGDSNLDYINFMLAVQGNFQIGL